MLRTAATHLRRQKNVLVRLNNANGSHQHQRTMITSAQKRALINEQISGNAVKKDAAAAKPPIAGASPAASASGGGGDGGGGGSSTLPLLVAGGAAAAGGAYYMGLIPMDMIMGKADEKKEEKEDAETAVENEEAELSNVVAEEEAAAKEEVVVASEEKKEEETVQEGAAVASATGNRVLNIHAPSSSGRKSEIAVQDVSHVEGGNRVTIAKFGAVYGATTDAKETKEATMTAGEVATQAEQELKSSGLPGGKSLIDEELARAHASMKASVDESYLKNLDELSPSDLRIRIVQLASEMGERTKWEAVRLREFLGMKEKEVGDKYLELMQKQRLEFEDLLARRLREQEANITKAANDALEAKEKSIESVVNAAASAQEAEYQAALKTAEARFEREIDAKHEGEYGAKLAEAKASFIKDLEGKVSSIENLTKRLREAEQNLQISRNFESGSQRAHRVSAAALALSEKMETSKAAAEELAALKSAAVENGVIASALETIPTSVKKGIPTLPELQGSFDGVYGVSRQAAYVPKGRSGVEGQLAGKLFATLTVPPSPDTTPPTGESDGKKADYILARAKQHIEVGELGAAVSDLDQLNGQVAFTVRDWKSAAMDRIAVDKALKVIKMECALMNKNMAG